MNFNLQSKIFIAGKNGMVGSACWRLLKAKGFTNLIGCSSSELDLRDQSLVRNFFKINKPEYVINAAAKVGGILANDSYPYNFLMDNMLIQNNLIESSLLYDVKKFIFLGSSCIYPRLCKQPIKEEYLLDGKLEPTNQWYAIAKISGVKLIESIRKQFNKDFISLMPTNLYGPGDNYDLNSSHVIPGMIKKFHQAKLNKSKNVTLWGTGSPFREFLYVEDLAEAVFVALSSELNESIYNIGSENEISIKDLAYKIKKVVGYRGDIIWDNTKPDGTPRKIMDSSRFKKNNWKFKHDLDNGLTITYNKFLKEDNV